MKDKFSREKLINKAMSAFDVALTTAYYNYPKKYNQIEQAKKQIKSILTPIPEEKLDEFVRKCRDYLFERFPINITGNAHIDWEDELKDFLKEYDELKEG